MSEIYDTSRKIAGMGKQQLHPLSDAFIKERYGCDIPTLAASVVNPGAGAAEEVAAKADFVRLSYTQQYQAELEKFGGKTLVEYEPRARDPNFAIAFKMEVLKLKRTRAGASERPDLLFHSNRSVKEANQIFREGGLTGVDKNRDLILEETGQTVAAGVNTMRRAFLKAVKTLEELCDEKFDERDLTPDKLRQIALRLDASKFAIKEIKDLFTILDANKRREDSGARSIFDSLHKGDGEVIDVEAVEVKGGNTDQEFAIAR